MLQNTKHPVNVWRGVDVPALGGTASFFAAGVGIFSSGAATFGFSGT